VLEALSEESVAFSWKADAGGEAFGVDRIVVEGEHGGGEACGRRKV
jgi:hypothetical protein